MNLQQLTIHPFPTSSRHDTCLLETEGRFFEIGKDTAELLEYLQANGGDEESIVRYAEVHNSKPSKEEISPLSDWVCRDGGQLNFICTNGGELNV